VFDGQENVDKLGYLADIATDLDLIGGVVTGDRPTSVSRLLWRLT